MRIETVQGGQDEARIVIAMITNKDALARIALRWDRQLFTSKYANIVGGWCVNYYNKHKEAPGKRIAGLFELWQQKARDKDTLKLVESFLKAVSDQYESVADDGNPDYIVDLAEKHFRRVRLNRLADEIKADLDGGDIDKAQGRIDTYKPIEISASAGIDLLRDQEALMRAFEQKTDPMITFSRRLEPLNRFFQGAFERESLIGIMAAEKVGKSWVLMELAWQAMLQRRKVAFFACGDMSQSQMERRWAVRAARHPLLSRDGWPCIVKCPVKMRINDGIADIEYEEEEFLQPLDWRDAWVGYQKAIERTKSNDTYLKLSCHPARSISVKGIEAVLATWDREGWTPDIICIDYADLLAQVSRDISPVQKVDEDWTLLSGLRQSKHCCVITATQVNAASYSTRTLRRQNFSSGHSKYGHCTGMMAISQDDEEKKKGLYRFGWIQLREGVYSETQHAYVASCLALANPMVLADF